MTTLNILFFVVIFYQHKLSHSEETCQIGEKPKLQIAFIVSYSLNRLNNWFRYQRYTIESLIDIIKPEFPGTEFSVVGFMDYPDSATPRGRAIDDPEVCYIVTQEMTSEKSKILAAINRRLGDTTNYSADDEDSLTTAMLFAAVDKTLKWNKGFYDSQGKIVRKIMILLVWRRITNQLLFPGNRTFPKADGTDTCTRSIPPSIEQLDWVLHENQFAVFNSIINDNTKEWHDVYYERELDRLFVPYYQFPIPGPRKRATSNGYFNSREYAGRILKKLKEEVMMCNWEDPISYNTLGL